VGIIATGALLFKVIMAAKQLEQEGIKIKVMYISTIKPLDSVAIEALARETKALVTVERASNHWRAWGCCSGSSSPKISGADRIYRCAKSLRPIRHPETTSY
jgi:pyruvate/2-oxoacid:ferredoxin oxidoreductase alpha subunit